MIVIFGSITMDLLMSVPELPRPGRKALSSSYSLRPGGKGANQAIAAARASSPKIVKLCGRAGEDDFGKKLIENLKVNGLDFSNVQVGPQPTALQHVAIDRQGDHLVTCATGANWGLRAASVPDELLTQETWLLCNLEVPPEEVWALIRRADPRGCRILLNCNPLFETTIIPPDILPMVDLLVLDYEEAQILAKQLSFSSPDAVEIARDLAMQSGNQAIITLGRRGSVAATFQGAWQFPAFPVDVVDTSGAGDAFCGILAVGLHNNLSIQDAIARATVGAGLACLALGSQDGMPKASTIDSWISDLPKPQRI